MGKSFAVKLELVRSLVRGIDYIVIDPFDFTTTDSDEGDPVDRKLDSLLTFLDLLLADPRHQLSPDEHAILHSALRAVYVGIGVTSDSTAAVSASEATSPTLVGPTHLNQRRDKGW